MQQTFILTKTGKWLWLIEVLFLIYAFYIDELAFIFLALLLLLIDGYKVYQSKRYSISVDREGIWSIHSGREKGLIHWSRVIALKEHGDYIIKLIDKNGKQLLSIDKRVENFLKLLRIIEKNTKPVSSSKNIFCKEISFYWRMPWFAALIVLSGTLIILSIVTKFFLVSLTINLLIYSLALLFIIFIAYHYTRTIYKIRINAKSLTLYYPFYQKTIDFSDIISVDINYTNTEIMTMALSVRLITRTQAQPLQLVRLGIDPLTLSTTLKKYLH